MMFLHQHYGPSEDDVSTMLRDSAKDALLRAVSDEDTELRNSILEYWTNATVSLTPSELMMFVLKDLHSAGSEGTYLHTASHVLLQATHLSAYYKRPLFENPIQNCKFWEMHVSPAWQARHASMVPLFTNTQGSTQAESSGPTLPQLVALTQGGEKGNAIGAILATQDKHFTQTQTVPVGTMSSTFNMGVEITMQEEMNLVNIEDKASRAPTQGSAGLVFSSTAQATRLSMYKRTGLGKTSLKPTSSEDHTDSVSTVNTNNLVRRRFVRQQDREKHSMHFARLEEKRKLLRRKLQEERKHRREAQVTMLREYRVGELPDIQIAHSAVIDPLQALAQRDTTTARHVLVTLVNGILDNAHVTTDVESTVQLCEQLRTSLCDMMLKSMQFPPQLINAILQVLLKGKMKCDSDVVTHACLSSGQEAIGILLLEKQILESQKQQRVEEPVRKRQKRATMSETTPIPTDAQMLKMSIHLAELYGSIGMWDAVRGILHSDLSSLHSTTHDALHAETLNQPMRAYELYLQALAEPHSNQLSEEQRVWEERICFAASELGQWNELETFVNQRFLTDPGTGEVNFSSVWDQQRPAAAVLPAFVNSRLMKLLSGAASDDGLVQFVSENLQTERNKLILEDNLSMQLAVLSIHQEKPEVARVFLNTTTNKLLQDLSHHSMVSTKPISLLLRKVQLILEAEDFLDITRTRDFEISSPRVTKLCKQWMNNLPSTKDDTFLVQSIALYRDLFLHFLETRVSNQDTLQLINKTRAFSHIAVVETALEKNNPHLASVHLRNLKSLLGKKNPSDRNLSVTYEFLYTKVNIIRGQQNGGAGRLRLLIEAWCKNLREVNNIQEQTEDISVEVQYLTLESRLCVELCKAIQSMGNSYDGKDKYLQVLAAKFPNVAPIDNKDAWYPSLLECSYNDLLNASKLSKNVSINVAEKFSPSDHSDAQNNLAKFCEESISQWPDCVDVMQYRETLVSATLKSMSSGSSTAHFNFPRLIHLLDDHPTLVTVFQADVASVPAWMFLLWLSHIMIYIDKNPGKALQPLVIKLALEYPQAVFYPFSVSKTGYKFDGETGSAAQTMCLKVEDILSQKCPILQQFLEAMSLVKEPFNDIKVMLERIAGMSGSAAADSLKVVHDQLFKPSSNFGSWESPLPGAGSELGLKFQLIREKSKEIFIREFGVGCNKLKKTGKTASIQKSIAELLRCWKNSVGDLKSLSPWLENYQSSNKADIEIPGQYTGFSKPLLDYHTKIAKFDSNLIRMKSLRSPIVVTMLGDDEKAYKFLVKTGEDLRTDQRIEQMFTLINNVYERSVVTRKLSVQPKLTTFSVVPLSVNVGILQWIDSTMLLRDLITGSLDEQQLQNYSKIDNEYKNKFSLTKDRNSCIQNYTDLVNRIPWDILKRSIFDLSSSYESFFHLRTNFCGSHAALSVSQWLLGIGDRHLSNFLVEYKTAKMVGIDFGHHFESATQFLPFPELVPFRMTPQIVNVMKPLGSGGIIRETMVSCLQALVESKDVLLAAVEAFVKEPTQDWIEFATKQEKSASDEKVEVYSTERIELITQKLSGVNPCVISEWAIDKNRRVDCKTKRFLTEVVFGENDVRSALPRYELTVPQQVDVLLALASDPNILGRTYFGWSPLT